MTADGLPSDEVTRLSSFAVKGPPADAVLVALGGRAET